MCWDVLVVHSCCHRAHLWYTCETFRQSGMCPDPCKPIEYDKLECNWCRGNASANPGKGKNWPPSEEERLAMGLWSSGTGDDDAEREDEAGNDNKSNKQKESIESRLRLMLAGEGGQFGDSGKAVPEKDTEKAKEGKHLQGDRFRVRSSGHDMTEQSRRSKTQELKDYFATDPGFNASSMGH